MTDTSTLIGVKLVGMSGSIAHGGTEIDINVTKPILATCFQGVEHGFSFGRVEDTSAFGVCGSHCTILGTLLVIIIGIPLGGTNRRSIHTIFTLGLAGILVHPSKLGGTAGFGGSKHDFTP
jgi:hypothetical protein